MIQWGSKKMKVYGKRTHHTRTEEVATVQLFVEFRWSYSLKKWYLHIADGGVTGYESISLDDLLTVDKGWYACAGTKGRWDTLYIPQKWIEIIRKEYLLDIRMYQNIQTISKMRM